MKLKFRSKAAISFTLVLATASLFTFSSFAASNTSGAAFVSGPVARVENNSPAGRLTGTGRFTIDGDQAQNGAAVFNGSTIATGAGSSAIIDLGPAGRIELRPNTTITLALSPGALGVKVAGASARVSVTSGQVEVRSNATARTLNANETAEFEGRVEASATGGSVFAVGGADSETNAAAAVPTSSSNSPGIGGVVALVGVAAAVTLGVMAGSNNDQPSGQLPRPSTVVP